MRVLYLNPFSQEVSGPDESLRSLLAVLVPMGIEAHVVVPAAGPQVSRYEALGARVWFAPLAVLSRNVSMGTALLPPRVALATSEVIRIARRVKAHLIHTNMEVLLEGGLAARTLGLPHVLHYRGNTLDRPKWVFDALTAVWCATADHVYCISRATASVFQRRGRGGKVEVLYNPVDVDSFYAARRSEGIRAELGGRSGQPLIGTVGRIHPRKDLETFIRAAALVIARVPTARFVIVGVAEASVERTYEKNIRRLVDELGIADRLTFAGPRRDMPAVMAALDLFVLTSRHEGFGRVVAEAMAACRPVVVSDEGAPPELVESGGSGLLAAAGDPEGFARQIVGLLVDVASSSALGRRAHARALAFDPRAAAARVKDRYDALVSRQAREGRWRWVVDAVGLKLGDRK